METFVNLCDDTKNVFRQPRSKNKRNLVRALRPSFPFFDYLVHRPDTREKSDTEGYYHDTLDLLPDKAKEEDPGQKEYILPGFQETIHPSLRPEALRQTDHEQDSLSSASLTRQIKAFPQASPYSFGDRYSVSVAQEDLPYKIESLEVMVKQLVNILYINRRSSHSLGIMEKIESLYQTINGPYEQPRFTSLHRSRDYKRMPNAASMWDSVPSNSGPIPPNGLKKNKVSEKLEQRNRNGEIKAATKKYTKVCRKEEGIDKKSLCIKWANLIKRSYILLWYCGGWW